MRRFAGWTLVLAGLGYAIVWLTFPIALAHIWAKVIVATGLVVVVVAVLVGAQRWTPKFGQLAKVGSRPRRRSLECHARDGVILLS